MSAAPVITIFVRHSADCKYAGDEFARRCKCRKHFRWTHNGTQQRRKSGTRSWEEAEALKRKLEDQLAGRAPVEEAAAPKSVRDAITLFLQDKQVQGITSGTVGKYTLELERLAVYCDRSNVYVISGVTRELLTGYCATWESYYPSSCTRSKVRERLRAFLRYCYEAKWLDRIPQSPKIKVDEAPTMPLVGDEYPRLLDALHIVNPRRWEPRRNRPGDTGRATQPEDIRWE